KANAGTADIDGQQTDHKRQRGEHLEVDEALDADAADSLQVAVSRNSCDEGGEDQRSDDRLDESKEDIAEDTERDRKKRSVEAQLRPGNHGDKDPGRVAAAAHREEPEEDGGEPAKDESRSRSNVRS